MSDERQEREGLSSDLFCVRGMGILLVVLVHVLGVDASHGVRKLYPATRMDLRIAFEFIHSFNMAVMMMGAGLVVAAFGRADSPLPDVLRKKWNKLIVPMLLWAPVLLMMRTVATSAPHTGRDWLTLLGQLPGTWIPPYSIFWFVHALVGCSLLLWSFQRFTPGVSLHWRGWSYFGLALPLGGVMGLWKAHGGGGLVEYFALILYWNCFFGLGFALHPALRSARGWLSRQTGLRQALLTTGCLALLGVIYEVLGPEHYEVACVLNGPIGFCMLFSLALFLRGRAQAVGGPWKRMWNRLVSTGSISMTLYLLHIFFTSGMRISLRHWNPTTPLWVHLVLGGVAGCVGPWLLFRFAQKHPSIHGLIGYSPRGPSPRGTREPSPQGAL